MIKDYVEFINEAKSEEAKVGSYVLFTKNYVRYLTKGKFGKIVNIKTKDDEPTVPLYQIEISKDLLKNGVKPAEDSVITPEGNIIISLSKIENLIVYDARTYTMINEGRIVIPEMSYRLKNILERIGLTVPEFEAERIYMDMTYIDIDDERDDVITYLSPLRMKDVSDTEKYKSRLRQYTRIGRFLRKLYPKMSEQDVAKAADEYKAKWLKMKDAKDSLQIVSGEDIRYWYLNKRYKKGNGSLNNSCMQYDCSQRRFDIYCENPEKISMVILTDVDEKLVARALLWKVDEPEFVYLDRVYSTEEKYANIVRDKAKESGWETYDNWNHGRCGVKDMEKMKVYVKRDYGEDSENPYMDTFRVFCKSKKGYYLTPNDDDKNSMYEYCDHD